MTPITVKSRNGFTLLEVLVVIAVTVVLTGIVLAFLSSARTSAADATIKSSMEGLRKEASIYFNDGALGNGSYGSYTGTTFTSCFLSNVTLTSSSLACGQTSTIDGTTSLCDTPAIKSRELIKRAVDASGVTQSQASRCRLFPSPQNTNGWVVGVTLKSSTPSSPSFWCVDSTGNSKMVSGALTSIFSTSPVDTDFSCP